MPESSAPVFQNIHISNSEFICKCCGKLPPDFLKPNKYDYYESFNKWERIRTAWGKPIPISSGWRCNKHQRQLVLDRVSRAVPSLHQFWALDCDLDTVEEVLDFADLVKQTYPEMRRGFESYLSKNSTIVHIDEAYLVKPKIDNDWTKEFYW